MPCVKRNGMYAFLERVGFADRKEIAAVRKEEDDCETPSSTAEDIFHTPQCI